MEMQDNVEVYDLETLRQCFTYTGKDVKTSKISQFVISEWRDDWGALWNHLKTLKGQIGFNNCSFDYPIIDYIMKSKSQLTSYDLWKKAQEIIDTPEELKFTKQIPEWKMLIPQLDLYKLSHFNNKAKRTSLKDLEFWMQFENVQDMPMAHDAELKQSDIQTILDYNLNDVEATYQFYLLCKDKIELRKQLSVQFGIRLINANDPKIGSDIILEYLSKIKGIDKGELRQMRTRRSQIVINDIIDTQIGFRTKEFRGLLEGFKSLVITPQSTEFDRSVIYKGFKYVYGLGGIHGCCKPGVYESDSEWIIKDCDVASLYPSIIIKRGLCPEHLGVDFLEVYKEIVNQRLEAKKNGNKVLNEGFKLSANGCYGKSSDENSYLYDPQFTMATTVNGQLYLTMLAEKLSGNIEDMQVLQINTDGLTVRIRREAEVLYKDICGAWEVETDLTLEYVNYQKMVISDVNNYLAIKEDGKVKYKGSYECVKESHKDTSFRIVQIALSEYFVKGIEIEQTIRNHQNIYDFCGRQKFRSDSYGEIRYISKKEDKGFSEVSEKQQKTTRYFISNKGATFIKVYPEKHKESFINKGYQVTIFNKFTDKPIEDRDINYKFYELETLKILESVEQRQLNLF